MHETAPCAIISGIDSDVLGLWKLTVKPMMLVFLVALVAVGLSHRQTGQQRLDETQGVFIPLPYERILQIQRKILVLPHQDRDSVKNSL